MLSRETQIRRDASGRWYDEGVPLEHPRLIQAFDSWVRRAPDGRWCLQNSIHWVYVTIEGAPLFVRCVQVQTEGFVLFFSNEQSALLDPATLRQDQQGRLYCTGVPDDLPACFDTHAVMALAEHLTENADGQLGLTCAGVWFAIPTVAKPLE